MMIIIPVLKESLLNNVKEAMYIKGLKHCRYSIINAYYFYKYYYY